QAEHGIRDELVTGVQTCALPICRGPCYFNSGSLPSFARCGGRFAARTRSRFRRATASSGFNRSALLKCVSASSRLWSRKYTAPKIGRASGREKRERGVEPQG